MSPKVSKALKELAARILVSTKGITLTGDKVRGVVALTDELIVVAADALEAAADAAPLPRPSGKALSLARPLASKAAAATARPCVKAHPHFPPEGTGRKPRPA